MRPLYPAIRGPRGRSTVLSEGFLVAWLSVCRPHPHASFDTVGFVYNPGLDVCFYRHEDKSIWYQSTSPIAVVFFGDNSQFQRTTSAILDLGFSPSSPYSAKSMLGLHRAGPERWDNCPGPLRCLRFLATSLFPSLGEASISRAEKNLLCRVAYLGDISRVTQ